MTTQPLPRVPSTRPLPHMPPAAPRLFQTRPAVWLLLLAVLCLPGCSTLLSPGPPPARLQLAPALPAATGLGAPGKQIVVSTPAAGRAFDTDRIALTFNGLEVRYLADARWTASVPALTQRAFIETLESAGAAGGVSDEVAGLAADVRLMTDIKDFSLHYPAEDAAPTAVFSANLRLLNLYTGKIIGVRKIESRVPAAGKDAAALARACESALEKALADMAPWVAESMRRLK